MTSIEPSSNLFPAAPDCAAEQIQSLSRQIMALDVSLFYGEIQAGTNILFKWWKNKR